MTKGQRGVVAAFGIVVLVCFSITLLLPQFDQYLMIVGIILFFTISVFWSRIEAFALARWINFRYQHGMLPTSSTAYYTPREQP